MASRKKKILFIEDEPDQIMMISLRLRKSGFYVVAARNGEEGLAKAVKNKPDLILLDIIMPDVDGFEVCRRLRHHPVTKKIPIIATTAAGVDDLERECLAVGANDCLRKPYDSEDLLTKIERMLAL